MQLQPGDVIDYSGIMIVCQIKRKGEQIVYSDGSTEMNYTRPEYIDYDGKGFKSCLFFAIPESFKKCSSGTPNK